MIVGLDKTGDALIDVMIEICYGWIWPMFVVALVYLWVRSLDVEGGAPLRPTRQRLNNSEINAVPIQLWAFVVFHIQLMIAIRTKMYREFQTFISILTYESKWSW